MQRLKEMEEGLRLFKFWLGIWNRCAKLHVCSLVMIARKVLVSRSVPTWKNGRMNGWGRLGCCLVTSIWVGFQELCIIALRWPVCNACMTLYVSDSDIW